MFGRRWGNMATEYIDHVDDSDDVEMLTGNHVILSQLTTRGRFWPRITGVVEIVVGAILTMLGVTEVFIIPMVNSSDENMIMFNKQTCYGCGIFTGFLMVMTGSTLIRASVSERNTTVNRFFNLTILSLVVFILSTCFLIYAYAKGWTTNDKYPSGSALPEVHFFVTLFTVLGLVFVASSLIQYFDIICCGDQPLWVPWLRCCTVMCCCLRMRRQTSFEVAMSRDLDNRCNPI